MLAGAECRPSTWLMLMSDVTDVTSSSGQCICLARRVGEALRTHTTNRPAGASLGLGLADAPGLPLLPTGRACCLVMDTHVHLLAV